MKYSHLIFDFDKTLYPEDSPLVGKIKEHIMGYFYQELNLGKEEAHRYMKYYMNTYESILTGLVAERKIDPKEFMKRVFGFNAEDYVTSNPDLRKMLNDFPQIKKIIFSNSPNEYIKRVILKIGIEDCIHCVYGRDDLDYFSKPDPRAYEIFSNFIDASPSKCIMVDDKKVNLKQAKNFGWSTVYLSKSNNERHPYIDHQISDIFELRKILV